jgi:hypothetical protein
VLESGLNFSFIAQDRGGRKSCTTEKIALISEPGIDYTVENKLPVKEDADLF